MSIRLIQAVQTSYEPGTYVLDGCLCNGGSSLALSISNYSLRLYDTRTTAFLFDLRDHNQRVTDVVSDPANPSILFSSQEDGGIMVSDLRQASAVHFLTDLCSQGVSCNTISVTPSGNTLGVAADGNVYLVDRRTWAFGKCIEQMHLDEITRLRFIDESVFCSAGEDQMINFITTEPGAVDDDILLQAINCGEAITKMSCFPELSATAMIGTLENGYVCPFDLEQKEAKYDRPGFDTYLVDWCVAGDRLYLISGVRDEDGNPGPLHILDWATRTSLTLPEVHKDLGRVAIGFGDRIITGGEDGLLAFWTTNALEALPSAAGATGQAASISSCTRGVRKQHVQTGSRTAAQQQHGGGRPYGQRGGRGGRGGGYHPHSKPY